jgi:hypothetical protein
VPTLRNHTHCQVVQKSRHTNQNLSKSMSAQTHGKIADPNKTKNSAPIDRKYVIVNKAQHLTRNIRKPGVLGILNFCTFIKNCNGLISWSFENPASAYCNRYVLLE